MSNHSRLNWVDMAKGLSIILVVMMHSAYGVGDETGGTGLLHWVIGFATPFRMPEFFLISGLFLSQVIDRDWRRFADRRVVHYLYFYALWAILQIGFKVGLGSGDAGAALTNILWATIEPYGVLGFIYLLAMVSAAAKLLHQLRVPHWAAFTGAAALQIAPVATGIYAIDQFAAYFVFFYSGYAFAPLIFKFVESAMKMPLHAVAFLAVWAFANGMLVFSTGYEVQPTHMQMGFAGLPLMHLVLALVGALALCTAAGLLTKVPFMGWLRWMGAHSIVIYLSFTIPMAAIRVILLKLGFITDVSTLSAIVFGFALVAPIVLYAVIQKTGFGKFLFERPTWAHIPGTPGSLQPIAHRQNVPAE